MILDLQFATDLSNKKYEVCMPEKVPPKKVSFAEENELVKTKEYYLSKEEKKSKVSKPEALSDEQKLKKQELEEQKLEKQELKKQKLKAKIKEMIPKSLAKLFKKQSGSYDMKAPTRENAVRKKASDISR
jgi:hypothetical protein